jgi:glycosyltransferase involved in cell wall biosynthesis
LSEPLICDVLIPARNEAQTLPQVLAAIPRALVRDVYVIDNASRDETGRRAVECGARLLHEPQPGYGAACLRGLAHLATLPRPPDVVVFLDADFADDTAELGWLLEPIRAGAAELVIGSRVLGVPGPGGLRVGHRIGNGLATPLIRMVYGQRYTDLGPFRAIRLPALVALGMHERGWGWAVEMQVKAAKLGLRVIEVPVRYRRRPAAGRRVVSRVRGTASTSYKILYTVLRHATAR